MGREKTKWLDAWRGLACLLVFMCHSSDTILGWGDDMYFLGKAGVAMLFLLSGYLLTNIYFFEGKLKSEGVLVFYIKRILRVYPLYIFTVIMAVALNWMSLESGIRSLLLMEQYGHFWVIPIEMLFYLTFPLMALLIKKCGEKKALVICTAVCCLIWYFYYASPYKHWSRSFVYCLPMFLLGIMSAIVVHEYGNGKSGIVVKFMQIEKLDIAMVVILVGTQLYGVLCYKSMKMDTVSGIISIMIDNTEMVLFMTVPVLFLVLFLSMFWCDDVRKFLGNNKILQYMGKVSYPFYLLHHVLGGIIPFHVTENGIIELLFCFCLTFGLSVFLFEWVEKPIKGILRKI